MSEPKGRPSSPPPKINSGFSTAERYGDLESFTAAYPRGQLLAELDDDDIDDVSADPPPAPVPAAPQAVEVPVVDLITPAPRPALEASSSGASLSWIYLVIAVIGGSMLAVASAGLAGVTWYLW
jgi:hypothetical protein